MNSLSKLLISATLAIGAATVGIAGEADNPYGPLAFNKRGADFYIAQDNSFVPAELAADGAIVFHLRNAPFQIGYNGFQLNLSLAQIPIAEIVEDKTGYKASRLSGPLAGAREPDSDELLVYGGTEWSDGNTEFSDATSRKASPMKGFKHAHQVNALAFVEDEKASLADFKGTLYGYVLVYRKHERRNRDIMPVRFMFE